ncbi:hypothetical protein LFL97_32330 [Burkholderia sp. JSH-S8]|nr:hypothetical protein LFL97_32330 [Burkholderia sp. JSH-S8]
MRGDKFLINMMGSGLVTCWVFLLLNMTKVSALWTAVEGKWKGDLLISGIVAWSAVWLLPSLLKRRGRHQFGSRFSCDKSDDIYCAKYGRLAGVPFGLLVAILISASL